MSQSDFGDINPAIKSGASLATSLNEWRDAVNSAHKGSAEPAYKDQGLCWLDDSLDPVWVLKIYDGTNWIPMLEVNITSNVAAPAGVTTRLRYPLAGGTANALTLTPTPPITAYADQDVATFEAASNNTAAVTLNVSGVGAKAIRKMVAGADVALVAGDILDGQRCTVNYDTAANGAAGAWILVDATIRPIASGGTGQSTAAGAFNALKQDASDTATGVVELATAAEVATGTDTARVPSVATMKSHQGMAKAWVNFNGSGTVAIRDSYNVSSITDNATGAYTINFATPMPNANYAMVSASGHSSGGGYVRLRDGAAPAVGSIAIDALQFNGGGLIDQNYIFAAFFGD